MTKAFVRALGLEFSSSLGVSSFCFLVFQTTPEFFGDDREDSGFERSFKTVFEEFVEIRIRADSNAADIGEAGLQLVIDKAENGVNGDVGATGIGEVLG